ncbi:LysR family transcriptional regulator [Neptunomonas qingdaonensis]|uniref:DNA-binding transcriptional regulator, LysR family n=1 Tax=Neptunomonas qingdaonensis TaxID=1045558 RepID=A0A1I2PZS6_9GAMM|nr:LysR family transcriptional regulator [Neptunomonas qingdaonensis]SFG21775.1 DNA-binding transcriptional regulator, LysR family [Neptunomonas qingdaonensis]
MLPELKVAQLRHFVWVAELKGFHAAAEKAHRTQPAISLSIRDLENKLGEGLFEKRNAKTAKTELTPFGKYFLPKAKELIAHHDRVAEDMMLLSEHKAGHLRLASVPSIASRVLPDILLKFVADLPSLHVSFFDDNSDAVLKMVENQQVDFGICHLFHEEDHSDKVFTPIWEDRIGMVCPKDHPLAGKEGVHWKELRKHRLISNGTSRLLGDTEARPLLGHSQFYVSNMISLIAMLEAGFGITTLPWYAFPQESTTLQFIPLITPEVTRRIGIVKLSNKSLTPPAQALVDFILEQSKS